MKKKSANTVSFETHSFNDCVRLDRGLAELRARYASKSAQTRRRAAEWEYDSTLANRMFGGALAAAGQDPCPFGTPRWPDGVLALAIDLRYSPALLTVGACEYQAGRPDEAMQLFLTLTELPADEPDLPIIIDKAGDFLLDEDDLQRAHDLYATAEKVFPDVAIYPAGLGYCLGKLGMLVESVAKARRVCELEPDNARHLSDLGWSLSEAGELDEAVCVLERAVELADADYDLPRKNLSYVKEQAAKNVQA